MCTGCTKYPHSTRFSSFYSVYSFIHGLITGTMLSTHTLSYPASHRLTPHSKSQIISTRYTVPSTPQGRLQISHRDKHTSTIGTHCPIQLECQHELCMTLPRGWRLLAAAVVCRVASSHLISSRVLFCLEIDRQTT